MSGKQKRDGVAPELAAVASKLAQLTRLGQELQTTGNDDLRTAEKRRAEIMALRRLVVSKENGEGTS